jgi:signal transduction histidine kinase
MMRHSLLARQIKKSFGADVPAECLPFLDAVDDAYRRFDDDREMLERSLELSSHELLQANADLEATLDSTRRLQEQVQRTQTMSAVGQLAAGVAHEINNPLCVILGFAQTMQRRASADHRDAEAIGHIAREALRCRNLVHDLLTFSRVGAPERQPMCLNAAVDGSLSLVQAYARTRHVEVRAALETPPPAILGQPNQIQQVVINLATNGIDAMPQGGVLTIATLRHEGAVLLSVRDTGGGIPPEVLPRIFEPFFTTKDPGRGTGLGLSMAYEIAVRHGGTIDVSSRPGQTELRVRFEEHVGVAVG